MNVSFEKLNDVEGKIIVNVEESDYKAKVEAEIKKIGRTHSIPGFRKGHVPMGQLVRMFGKQVKSDVLNQEVYEAVVKYIQDNKLGILGEPLPVDVKEISIEQKDFTFAYEIGLAPAIEINLDKSVTLDYYPIKVSDEMAEQQDKMLRERFGKQEPGQEFEERALVKGVLMELNADGTVKSDEDAIQVTAGIVAPFLFKSKEEAAKFEGKKVGDKVVFNPSASCEGNVAELSSMLNIDKERAAEVKADFELAISEIIVNRLAEYGQEFYDDVFGKDKVTSEEDYHKNVTAMIAAQLAPNSENLFQYTTEKALVEKYGNFELPAEFLKKWLVARNEGLTSENIDAEYEKMVPSIKWQLVKERVAQQAGVKIEKEDLENFAKAIAAQQLAQYGMYNLGDDVLADYAKRILEDKNSRSHIIEQIGDRKLFDAIKNLVTVDVKEVSLDEFKEIAEKAQA
ncbi:trigger factor [Muribaculaceae bacterium Isolate-002 (NCI)]|nr:trigger factor [Muribaculaceae bacterium Isolate-002 (NCI)]